MGWAIENRKRQGIRPTRPLAKTEERDLELDIELEWTNNII